MTKSAQNIYWNTILKDSCHELRVVLNSFHSMTPSSCIHNYSIISCNLSLPVSNDPSPKQTPTAPVFLLCTLPIRQHRQQHAL